MAHLLETTCRIAPTVQIHVDGEVILQTNNDDSSWRVAAGPILYNSLYNGEIYDGRIEEQLKGWTTRDFDDSGWESSRLAVSAAKT